MYVNYLISSADTTCSITGTMVTLHYSFPAEDPQALVEWDVFELLISVPVPY